MKYMNDHVNGCSTSKDIGLATTMGLMPGYDSLDKFGVNPIITPSSDPEDVWEFGGQYQYDADGTAPIMYLSSDSVLDVGLVIEVSGLDIDGNFVSQEVITDGQNVVLLETPLWRCFRAANISDFPYNVDGILYIHTDPTPVAGVPETLSVRAIINGDHNQTLMAVYTIPKGKVGFLLRGELGVELEGNSGALAEYAHCHYESRRYGKNFRVKKAVTCLVGGSANYLDKRSLPDVIPALTDIRLRVIEVSQTMGTWGTFDILLVDEENFNEPYLDAIGQIRD